MGKIGALAVVGENDDLSFGGKAKTESHAKDASLSSEGGATSSEEKERLEEVEDAIVPPEQMVRDAAAARPSGFLRASNDLWSALSNWTLWWRLALLDIRSRYRRTTIGPFWNVLSVAILVVALGFVYALLWRVPYREYLPYFSAGYVTWVFITGTMNEHSGSFIAGANMIRSMTMPMTLHIVRPLFRNILIFFHALVVHIVAVIALQYNIENPLALLLFPVGLMILSANLLWIGIALAVLCARYRDFIQVITSILQVAFFITPIFWYRDMLQTDNAPPAADLILADLNPFYHMVDVVRAPLIGVYPHTLTYVVTIGAAVVGLAFSLFILGRSRGRIAYWV